MKQQIKDNSIPSALSKFSPDDFTKHITAEGYQIKYKGQNIGGAGIIGKSTSRGENRRRDITMYNEMANRDIDNILDGCGSQHYLDAIQRLSPALSINGDEKQRANMPNWNRDNYKSFRDWAEKCYDAGQTEYNETAYKVMLKALSLLADINGSYLTMEKCQDVGSKDMRQRSLNIQNQLYKLTKNKTY
jgi:hypothetical protein